MAPSCLSLLLARAHHFNLLLDLNVKDLLIEDDLSIAGVFQTLLIKLLPSLLHLLQVPHTSHVQYLASVTNSSVLISQRAQLIVHIALVPLGARARQPFDTGTLLIRVPIAVSTTLPIHILALHPAVLLVERIRSPPQRLVPKEHSEDVVSVV